MPLLYRAGPYLPDQHQSDAFAPPGLARLHHYRALMGDWPTVAIGGISEERVAAVKASGVGSIALVSAITASDDWLGATERLLAAVGRG